MKVAVVGGGLAGLAAALDLVDAGVDVTLYEARPYLVVLLADQIELESDVSVDRYGESGFSRCHCFILLSRARGHEVKRHPQVSPWQ